MRVLRSIKPSPEQLKLIITYQPGFFVIRGAAGSGKTTTAVLRLRHVTNVWQKQREREGGIPVRVLVLTYNKTLRGYVERLVSEQVDQSKVDLALDTFSHWAMDQLDHPEIVDMDAARRRIEQLGGSLGLSTDFLVDEVSYVRGRFERGRRGDYADPSKDTYARRGRGQVPRMETDLRERLLDEVIYPYEEWLVEQGAIDWNDLAELMIADAAGAKYEVVVVDEAQDFSANQVRAVKNHLAGEHSTTFVLDAVQRIYPNGFDWKEAGIEILGSNSHRLSHNFRNTKEIAAFAFPLVSGLPPDDDGTLPEFEETDRTGAKPTVVCGLFRNQIRWVVDHIQSLPDGESVGILHPKGGGWFDFTRQALNEAGVVYVEITRRSDWPQGPEEVALSTMNSAKGIEFDHVVLLGLAAEMLPHGPEANDSQLANHRRLIAMAVGRARKSVVLTYKPGEESKALELLDPDTYDRVDV
jgi:superfamily I DNA/RNA helicase